MKNVVLEGVLYFFGYIKRYINSHLGTKNKNFKKIKKFFILGSQIGRVNPSSIYGRKNFGTLIAPKHRLTESLTTEEANNMQDDERTNRFP